MKKLLLISVSAGAGHVRAAEAIKKTSAQQFPELQVTHIDMMDYVTRPLKKAIVDSYELMATQLPELWRFVYKKTNRPERSRYIRELTKILNLTNARRLFAYIEKIKPDHILSTHFLPSHALRHAPKKYCVSAPLSLLMTDYDKHGLLMTPGMARYFVSNEKMRWKMIYHGIAPDRITVSGIPIDPIFYEDKPITELKRRYNVVETGKVLLVLSGGQGLAKLDKVVVTLFGVDEPITIFVIAGNNKKLEGRLRSLVAPGHVSLRIVGWTNQIDEYMRLADVIITKTGGLSTTECATLGKPIIATSPIPGQEEHNAEYLLQNGLGVIAHLPEDLLYYVAQNPARLAPGLEAWQNKQKTRPRAAEIILRTIARLAPNHGT